MAYEQRELDGATFPNRDKQEGDTRPDYKGRILVLGVEYWIDEWDNVSKKGAPYRKIKLTPIEERQQKEVKSDRIPANPPDYVPPAQNVADVDDDNLPF